MVMPVIHDVFTITHQFSINYITLNLQVPLPLLAPELYLLPCTTAAAKLEWGINNTLLPIRSKGIMVVTRIKLFGPVIKLVIAWIPLLE